MRARLTPALLAVAALARGQANAPPPVTADAVWTPPAGFLSAMHAACDARSGAAFGECFVAEMTKAGAPPAAVVFARRTDNQGYLVEFRDTGVVDVGCAEYPFRANENGVCFLLNGEPPLLDVDDPKWIGKSTLLANPAYGGLAKKYPDVAIFPGPRSSELAVIAVPLPGGAQRFQVDYSLRDGCHACARVGVLRMDFDFDASGRFAGTKVSSARAVRR